MAYKNSAETLSVDINKEVFKTFQQQWKKRSQVRNKAAEGAIRLWTSIPLNIQGKLLEQEPSSICTDEAAAFIIWRHLPWQFREWAVREIWGVNPINPEIWEHFRLELRRIGVELYKMEAELAYQQIERRNLEDWKKYAQELIKKHDSGHLSADERTDLSWFQDIVQVLAKAKKPLKSTKTLKSR